MLPHIFSTQDLPRAKQLDAWKGWFDGTFEVSVDNPEEGFAARSETWTLGNFGLSRVEAPRLHAIRTPSLVRRNPIDHWNIAIGHQRTYGEAGKGRALDVPAGTPFIVSLGHDLASTRGSDTRLQLYLPRDAFYELAPALDGAIGRALNTPLGRMLADFMIIMEKNLPNMSQSDLPGLQDALRAMLSACLAPSRGNGAAAANQIAATRRERVRRIVDENLGNAALGPELICRQSGMSRSQLYRIFELDGGVARFILSRRLKKAYAELADPWNANSISSVAYAIGFEDASQFSRSFRREFGITPSDVRNGVLSGQQMPIAAPLASHEEARTLHHLLTQVAHG